MCWSSCAIWSCYMDCWCSTWWRIGISVVVSSWSKWLVCWSFKALCWCSLAKNITYLMFACNYMEQQRLSSEIGIQMHVCKSNNPNDKQWRNFARGCPWARDGWVPHWLRSACTKCKKSKRATRASLAAWGPGARLSPWKLLCISMRI